MSVKGSPIVLMMMLEKVATPPDAATVVVPPRSPLAGLPFRSSATETFSIVARLEVSVLVLHVERGPEGDAPVT